MLKKMCISNKCWLLIKESLKKYCSFHKKILSSTNVFSIDNNENSFLGSILEWFLRDHMTLKTGVMASKSHLCFLELDYMLLLWEKQEITRKRESHLSKLLRSPGGDHKETFLFQSPHNQKPAGTGIPTHNHTHTQPIINPKISFYV